MAHAGVVLDKDQFNCSVCLEILKDPVTIPCGHSYCSNCIKNYWDQDDFLGVFACPQCRKHFSPRPLLARNTMLADVVEKFRTTGFQEFTTPPDNSPAEANDVQCDVCAGLKNKAVKSCLVCLASYCELHIQPHYDSAAFKTHKLVSATKRLQETICGQHNKLLEVFCRTDRQCICYLCLTDEHKGHDTVLAEVEIQDKQRVLVNMKRCSQAHITQREKEAQELQQAILCLTRSARSVVEESDALFTQLIRWIELKRFEVRELVKVQEKTSIGQAELLLEKIQKEIAELKMNEDELDKLSLIEDHISFLQSCQSVQVPPELSTLPPVTADPSLSFGPVLTAVSDLKGLLQEVCEEGFVCIYQRVKDVVIVIQPDPVLQPDTAQASSSEAPMEPAQAMPLCGRAQSSVSPLNPFLDSGPSAPTFNFTQAGSKLSSGFRSRHVQRRAHPRRK
ncbi:finTRIM family, member 67 [Nelusetta ayraudi]|uniref:finTRIM family, member 67 n=1 Tax=Nelusetta ayraudi TaxID=303726 RepID=UPI003F71D4E8